MKPPIRRCETASSGVTEVLPVDDLVARTVAEYRTTETRAR